MRSKVLLALAMLAGATLVPASPASAGATVRLAVFGDDGVTADTRANVDGAVADGAQAYVGLGDYYYWRPPSEWKDLFRPLTSKGAYLALGNHDDLNAIREFVPDGNPSWSRVIQGARFVTLNTQARMDVGSTQYEWAKRELCQASEPMRVLVMHRSWWLGAGAKHPSYEFPGSPGAMDQMVKDCGVDLVLASHEHNYQRMVRNGVHYVIVGTGGQDLNAVGGSPAGTVATCVCFGRLLLDINRDGYTARFKTTGGSVRDTFSPGSTGVGEPDVQFTPRDGNEWWVQVKVSGGLGAQATRVEARDTGGGWASLTKRSWGDWAASYHVEPGHLVRYRATMPDGRTFESCDHTHPEGVPRCGSSAPPPSSSGGFSATFRPKAGNEWWVEVFVDANQALSGVAARANGGAWQALSKRDWGAWAGSFHAPEGSLVEFRATSTSGATVVGGSACWPTATSPPCGVGTSGASSGTFSASFRNVRGNEWWVEADVDADRSLAGVDARVDSGAWVALEEKRWGSWAKSLAAPAGSFVELRARASDGATATSPRYAWPP